MKQQQVVEFRCPLHLVEPLAAALRDGGQRESVVFCLASHSRVQGRTLVLIKRLIPLPEEAYMHTTAHGAAWPGRSMLPILNHATAERLGLVVIHAHHHSGKVALSDDDLQSAATLLPFFQNQIPSRPHASVVLGEDHAAGVVLLPGESQFHETVRFRQLGKALFDRDTGGASLNSNGLSQELHNEIHCRQALLTGTHGERNIRQAKIAVVGLSGGGSHVVQQLAHMGIGEIIGIDGDRAETSNRGRLIGMTALDAFFRRRKTSVMARLVRRINRRVKFRPVPYPLPRQAAMDALRESDVVVGCLDNYHAKADLQELAWRYLIPYIDIGLLIRPDARTGRITIGGTVATLIPGGFCQWCIDLLSQAKLDAETGGRPRSYFEGAKGQAQVVSFNGSLASQAATEVLQLLTAFGPQTGEFSIKKFDGLEGTLECWRVKKNPNCSHCRESLSAGDVVWEKLPS